MKQLPKKTLNETFSYDDKVGHLYRITPVRGSNVGAYFGGVSPNDGYIKGKFNGKGCFEHRLIWEYFNGPIPCGMYIDHIDHNPSNNNIKNLRIVTESDNARNKPLINTNKSGVCGVHWAKSVGKWVAQIKLEGKSMHLGQFSSLFDAVCRRRSEELKNNFHDLHGIGRVFVSRPQHK